jgi:hypothetical protein
MFLDITIYLLSSINLLLMNFSRFKITFFLSIFFLFTSCNSNTSKNSPAEEIKVQEIVKLNKKDIETIEYTEYGPSDLTLKETQNWLKFQELNTQIELLKKGDLSFFNNENELLSTFFKELKSDLPDRLESKAIVSRISALETVSFKLEGTTRLKRIDKATLLNYVKDVLIANTNLVFQINKKLEQESQIIEK